MTTRTRFFRAELTPEVFNGKSRGHLPGLTGVEILEGAKGGDLIVVSGTDQFVNAERVRIAE